MPIFVGVGSNIEPYSNVKSALVALHGTVGVRALSTFYRTPPLDRPGDPPFVNGVVELGDVLAPLQLKQLLRRTEEGLGRQRGPDRNAPRTVDLDLLLYGDLVCNSDELRLPHPTILERPFVAVPLLELAPDLVIPGSGATLRSLVATISPYPMEPLPDLTDELRKELSNGP
jgi:2-amino-4-hydroxy-6-hydroxymethyldihydropteridine diphosphokinase